MTLTVEEVEGHFVVLRPITADSNHKFKQRLEYTIYLFIYTKKSHDIHDILHFLYTD